MNEQNETSLAEATELGDIHNRFGADLLDVALETPGRNALLSPASIAILLAMLHAGARGQSRDAIEKIFHSDAIPDLQASTAAFLAHLRSFSGSDGLELLSANGMWGQSGYSFDPGYVRTVQAIYEGEIAEYDFKNDPEGACSMVNTWVSEKTRGMIPAILESLDPVTRLVLGNAIYFKALWAVPMDEPQPITVRIDRPFLFAIRDNESGANLFLGQVHDPTDM